MKIYFNIVDYNVDLNSGTSVVVRHGLNSVKFVATICVGGGDFRPNLLASRAKVASSRRTTILFPVIGCSIVVVAIVDMGYFSTNYLL